MSVPLESEEFELEGGDVVVESFQSEFGVKKKGCGKNLREIRRGTNVRGKTSTPLIPSLPKVLKGFRFVDRPPFLIWVPDTLVPDVGLGVW